MSADLHSSWAPRREHVIDDERDTWLSHDIAPLLAPEHAVTADIDRVCVGVVAEADGREEWGSICANRRQATELLALEVLELKSRKDAHLRSPFSCGSFGSTLEIRLDDQT
jgi:hypothetical protein